MTPNPHEPVRRAPALPEPVMPDPGTFAWRVLHERHPALIERVREALPFGPAENAALDRLRQEATEGHVTVPDLSGHPDGSAADWPDWVRPHLGRRLDRTPFLFAESYFYRRLLDATGFHRAGPWHGVDPFGPMKNAELEDESLEKDLEWHRALDDAPPAEQRDVLLTRALWGNRADLGFRLSAASPGADRVGSTGASGASDASGSTSASTASTAAAVLTDDSATLWSLLDAAAAPRILIVADNTGRELIPDLLLTDHLLRSDDRATVALHVKPAPYYVSDATPSDVLACLTWLAARPGHLGDAARRLRSAATTGRLAMRTHPFNCGPLTYHAMPADLAAEFAAATVTVMKGDLNYRRLVGDRHWPPSTPFEAVTGYFPSPVVALRTLKSDVAVGLDPATLDALGRTGEAWRTSGTHAVVQART